MAMHTGRAAGGIVGWNDQAQVDGARQVRL